MNTFRFISLKKATMLFLPLFFLSAVLFTACKEDETPEEAYFYIENVTTGLTVPAQGVTSPRYVVRSNRPWKIAPLQESSWIKAFPEEGEDDGIFEFTVTENKTFESRLADIAFIVGDQEFPVLFRIEQAGNVPYISVDQAGTGVSIPAAGGSVEIKITANVDWQYSIDDDSWITSHEKTKTGVIIAAPENFEPERTLTLTVTSPEHPEVSAKIVVTQSDGSVMLEENFNWLAYGNAIPYETSGEKRYDTWTEAEKARGWYSTPVTTANNEQLCYARQGFVKLGKTDFGGDLISPKLARIKGTVNIKVTFKAAGYISAGSATASTGAKDDNLLKIFVLGAGTASVESFIINNYPNDKGADNAGVVNNIWADDRAYTFTVTGATSETQIKFMGGEDYSLKGIGQGKNRIFLDDIKVELIN